MTNSPYFSKDGGLPPQTQTPSGRRCSRRLAAIPGTVMSDIRQ